MPRVPRVTEVVEAPPARPAVPSLGPQWPGVVVEPIDGVKPADEPVGGVAAPEGSEGVLGDPGPVSEPSNAEVRAWARGQQIEVSDSGPVPRSVREQWDRAHGRAGS